MRRNNLENEYITTLALITAKRRKLQLSPAAGESINTTVAKLNKEKALSNPNPMRIWEQWEESVTLN